MLDDLSSTKLMLIHLFSSHLVLQTHRAEYQEDKWSVYLANIIFANFFFYYLAYFYYYS